MDRHQGNTPARKPIFGLLRSRSTPDLDEHAMDDIPPMPERPRIDSVKVDPFEGHSDVTRGPAPPRKLTLDDLIDPRDIPDDPRWHCRSPSGDILNKQQFLSRPDRPDSIRERQEKILQKTRSFSNMSQLGKDEPPPPTPADLKALPPLPRLDKADTARKPAPISSASVREPIPMERRPRVTAGTGPPTRLVEEVRAARERAREREEKRRQRKRMLTCGCSSQ